MSLLAPHVLSVDHLTAYLQALLEEDAILSDVWVRGEVSNFHRSAAGHCYFSLSSDSCQIRCVLFRSNQRGLLAMPENGDVVLAHGRVSIYASTGQYQLYVDNVAPEGTGLQQLQFEELQRRLAAEGLFAIERKRPLPSRPAAIGVVTSAQGAVWHDICNVVSRRYPLTRLVLSPSAVQGPGAPEELVAAIRALQNDPTIEVIIDGRGGGSAEDLASFNDEGLARAIYAAPVPVVSAVGHETDVTIADLVADVRAPTPSAAAELCVPSMVDIQEDLRQEIRAARACVDRAMQRSRHDLRILGSTLSRCSPVASVDKHRLDIDILDQRRANTFSRRLSDHRSAVDRLTHTARLLDPRDILRRGYALVSDADAQSNGRIATVHDAQKAQHVRITFQDGSITARTGDDTP